MTDFESSDSPLFRTRNLVVYSGDYRVLKDISVEIQRRRFTVIIGPTGCGKSTLIKALAGLLVPEDGAVLYNGTSLTALSEKALLALRKINGFVFQDSALWQNKSIFDNLSLPLRFHHPEMPLPAVNAKVDAALRDAGLLDSIHLRPAQLSTGEQKIISLQRALITEPSILFLDEPTVQVDPATRRKIIARLQAEKAKGTTLIAVTHDSEILTALADDLILLRDGFIVTSGPAALLRESTDESVLEIIAESLAAKPRRTPEAALPEDVIPGN
jgi:ABC-type transporter Mla maintaining outer membrane lipid asymmetry ATPase subunit MlaF